MVYPMDDQFGLITSIIDAHKDGDNDKALAMVCELNATAEARGFGGNYWREFCESMIRTHKALAAK